MDAKGQVKRWCDRKSAADKETKLKSEVDLVIAEIIADKPILLFREMLKEADHADVQVGMYIVNFQSQEKSRHPVISFG